MINKEGVDVLLPTRGERMNGLLYQAWAFLNQSYPNLTLWILVDSDRFKGIETELKSNLPLLPSQLTEKFKIVEIPSEWRGRWGHGAIRYAIENLPLEGEWLITSGDDDCVMEWGVKSLVEGSNDNVDMVVGLCIPVKRNYDIVRGYLGERIEKGNITGSCCLYRRSRVMEVGYDDSTYAADWVLINKMMKFPYKQLNTVLFVMPQSYQ